MKKLFVTMMLSLLSLPAAADVIEVVKPELWTLYEGTRIVTPRVDYSTLENCETAAAKYDLQYNCRGSKTFIKRKPIVVAPPAPPVTPPPVVTPEPPVGDWQRCAAEFTWCGFEGTKEVLYKAGSVVSIVKTFTGGVQCENSSFHTGDPAPGIAKECFIKVGSGTVTLPPTTPPAQPDPPAHPPEHGGGQGYMPVINNSLIPASNPGYATLQLQSANGQQPVSSPHDNGAFRVWCDFSHMNYDDAIVYPGQQGRAHLHTYFGNTKINHASTAESARTSGNSTCNGGIMNRSAYWVPAMIDTSNGAPLRPRNILVYYKHGKARTIPRGLVMIAGDMNSSSPQPMAWYECNELYASRQSYLVPCGRGGLLSASVTFMDCWDGVNLDSANHKSHMAYSTNGRCPSTHPERIPTINVIAYYHVTKANGTDDWRLSSDNYPTTIRAGYSAHADFMMGWDETLHKVLVDNCINKALDCHAHLTGDGRQYY